MQPTSPTILSFFPKSTIKFILPNIISGFVRLQFNYKIAWAVLVAFVGIFSLQVLKTTIFL